MAAGPKRRLAAILALLAIVPIVAIGLGILLIQVLHIPAPGARDVPTVLEDCVWLASAETWIDENGNGIKEEGEPPLPGVDLRFALSLPGWKNHADGTSDEKGRYTVDVFYGSCQQSFSSEVTARVPEGYEATTPTRVSSPPAPQAPYQFGFRLLPAAPTPAVVP